MKITSIDGVVCRHWRGVTEGGVPCEVFVHLIAVRDIEDFAQFHAELQEQAPPPEYLPLQQILAPNLVSLN